MAGFHPFRRIAQFLGKVVHIPGIANAGKREREDIERARRPLPPRPPGVPEPKRPQEPPPPETGIDRNPGFDWEHGPYPDHWGRDEIEFWDSEPNTYRAYYNSAEWQDLQEAFDKGWIKTGMTKEAHDEWRERFYLITGVLPSSFDWEAFREYLRAIGSPTVH